MKNSKFDGYTPRVYNRSYVNRSQNPGVTSSGQNNSDDHAAGRDMDSSGVASAPSGAIFSEERRPRGKDISTLNLLVNQPDNCNQLKRQAFPGRSELELSAPNKRQSRLDVLSGAAVNNDSALPGANFARSLADHPNVHNQASRGTDAEVAATDQKVSDEQSLSAVMHSSLEASGAASKVLSAQRPPREKNLSALAPRLKQGAIDRRLDRVQFENLLTPSNLPHHSENISVLGEFESNYSLNQNADSINRARTSPQGRKNLDLLRSLHLQRSEDERNQLIHPPIEHSDVESSVVERSDFENEGQIPAARERQALDEVLDDDSSVEVLAPVPPPAPEVLDLVEDDPFRAVLKHPGVLGFQSGQGPEIPDAIDDQVEFLRREVANNCINYKNLDDNSEDIFTAAVRSGNFEAVKILFEGSKRLNDSSGGIDLQRRKSQIALQSDVSYCVEHNNPKMLKYLIKNKFPVNVADKIGCRHTPLTRAASMGYMEMTRILLGSGNADMMVTDKNGLTAFMHAAKGGHVRVIADMLKTKYIPNLVDGLCKMRCTARDYAVRYKKTDVVDYIDSFSNMSW